MLSTIGAKVSEVELDGGPITSMSALPSKADILCVERNLVTMIFPTRFPTELLTTGWEMTRLDDGWPVKNPGISG